MLNRVSPARPTLRFGSIIPIVSITDVGQQKTIPINDRVDFEYVDMAINTLEEMLYSRGPDRRVHPELLSGRDEQQLVAICRELRNKLLGRIGLIDPDYAGDPNKRAAVAKPTDNDCFLLTGDDAQPYLEAEALDQRIRAIHKNPTLVKQLEGELNGIYQAQGERLRTASKSPRTLNLQVAALPGAETLSGLLTSRIYKIPRAVITDLTVG